MNIAKLIELAQRLDTPDLVTRGAFIATDIAEFARALKENAMRARHVLSEGDRAELDAIHTEAIAAADALDAKLAQAALR